MKIWIASALCFLASFSANAVTETNKTILSMGVQDTVVSGAPGLPPAVTQAYAILSPPPTGNCLYNVVYIRDLSTAGGTALLSMLQAAYTQSKPLSRIDYDRNSTTGVCSVNLIELSK